MTDQPDTIDGYIAAAPPAVRTILADVRDAIRRAVPDGEETISYQIPTIKVDGRLLVSFGAWKRHIGIYPVGEMDDPIDAELEPYRGGRATLRFPLGVSLPIDLIERVVSIVASRRSTGA